MSADSWAVLWVGLKVVMSADSLAVLWVGLKAETWFELAVMYKKTKAALWADQLVELLVKTMTVLVACV